LKALREGNGERVSPFPAGVWGSPTLPQPGETSFGAFWFAFFGLDAS